MQFSEMLAGSNMVPKAYQGKPQDILVCVQWGYEIGLAPMQALQNIAVINGKPSVYGDAAMALVQASPVCDNIEEYFEGEEGSGKYRAVCVAHRKGRQPVTATFSVEDAKRAGLWGKQGPWQAYPKRMLQMRARGFALRDAFPDVLKGLITAEEAQDFPDEERRPAKEITPRKPANPLDVISPPDPPPAQLEAPALAETELQNVPAESVEPAAESEPVVLEHLEVIEVEINEPDEPENIPGFALMVPGKDEPFSMHGSLEEWQDAYEALADRTARAGKVPPRDRMTRLRELREANDDVMKSMDSLKRVRHVAAQQQRLAALGAAK
jgi:hypothetical protein